VTARILIVDDDHNLVEDVTDMLTGAGYQVEVAYSGRQGLQIVNQTPVDLIVSDVMMPEMSGFAFCKAVRANPAWANIPFIFLTAKTQQKDIRLGRQLGADDYLGKPFEIEDLLIAVETRLRRVQQIQEAVEDQWRWMKRQFVDILGHELNTPLTYVYTYSKLLDENGPDVSADDLAVALCGIRKGADRLERLVRDMLLLIRLDSGVAAHEYALSETRASLTKLVANVLRKQREHAEQHNIELRNRVPASLWVQCSPDFLEDIVSRLVDNAVKFTPCPGGVVVVSASPTPEGMVEVSVSDTGVGIADHQIDSLFERFSQIDRKQWQQPGVGLGLAIARQLVELHGGQIRVESQPGEGSTFTFSLKRAT
jgi:two-component system sensor histidine kinase/response regulator